MSLNLILKFLAKESIISMEQTLGKETLADSAHRSKSQEEK
jgi:hypothetical protein